MKPFFILCLAASCWISCSPKAAWSPSNVGREYGAPKVPMMVSHLPKANQWAMGRTGHHYSLRQILCFDYKCRRLIGRRKVMKAISFEDFQKRIKKNAKKGVYDKPVKPVKPEKPKLPDTLVVKKETTPPPLPEVDPLLLKADSVITLSDLLFETNSYKLREQHYSALDELADFLTGHPSVDVFVSGHTDTTGTERHNVSLSTRRAEVVAEYLVDQGVGDDRISYEGFGSSRPIDTNDTDEGRRKNRRVEILLSNKKK